MRSQLEYIGRLIAYVFLIIGLSLLYLVIGSALVFIMIGLTGALVIGPFWLFVHTNDWRWLVLYGPNCVILVTFTVIVEKIEKVIDRS